MADIVDKKTRSKMMSGIKSKDTKPELIIRKGLFARGLRYRLHDKHLPGKPDIVFHKLKAVIFINGCFWHGHMCHLFKWPSTRPHFWKKKIDRNIEVDNRNYVSLKTQGWRILTVWECTLKGKTRLDFDITIDEIEEWIRCGKSDKDISGT